MNTVIIDHHKNWLGFLGRNVKAFDFREKKFWLTCMYFVGTCLWEISHMFNNLAVWLLQFRSNYIVSHFSLKLNEWEIESCGYVRSEHVLKPLYSGMRCDVTEIKCVWFPLASFSKYDLKLLIVLKLHGREGDFSAVHLLEPIKER